MPIVSVTPVISTSAYADGDVIGGKLTFEGVLGKRGVLKNIMVVDADGEGIQIDFFLFDAELTGTTGYTDNATFAINTADLSKCIGVTSIATADYYSAGADEVGTKTGVDIILERGANGVEDLYVVGVVRAAATFTTTSDLRIAFGYELDGSR